MFQRIFNGISRRARAIATRVRVARGMVVLHGPARVTLRDDEVAVIALVKDAAYFMPAFLAHHQRLGVRHIVLIDNGSTDATVAIAQGFADVTVLRNTLPAKQYEIALRVAGARVVQGGWLLFADADELFEAPLGAPLPQLTAYLNQREFTAMVTQMLDLFAPAPYAQTKGWDYATVIARADRYSLGQMETLPYHEQTRIDFSWFLDANHGEVALKRGGLRAEVFGEACFLSKHSLVRNIAGVAVMVHPHCASGVRVADVTGLLRHYKLAGDYLARDAASVAAGTWDHAEDAKRLAAAVGGDAFVITPAQSQVYAGPGLLVDQGFLEASDAYRAFIT
ncbi:Glycosyl transferase family 2 [Pseudorhodobacter antarcticus]|uniref:Glycosyl transferase family 2 n=1 Tax=Pseudorhodobacter antarcticus TaxID=1077947 RepID=A0A1H8HMI6_9RHOB|nr:glycosyltransferase family 2 protein [Pseudorhodobacter antarcticus]SEN57442.1 Glycosyl transferase family 2 [Pseudorhodobacter antarcticus]